MAKNRAGVLWSACLAAVLHPGVSYPESLQGSFRRNDLTLGITRGKTKFHREGFTDLSRYTGRNRFRLGQDILPDKELRSREPTCFQVAWTISLSAMHQFAPHFFERWPICGVHLQSYLHDLL